MAANSYIELDTSKPIGAQIVSFHDQLLGVANAAEQLRSIMLQANVDGDLATVIGASSADNASAILDLVGGCDINFKDNANSFLQALSRIGRKSF